MENILANEEWRTVDQNQDYEISSLGRVRRRVANRRNPAGYLLSPTPAGKKYLQVILSSGKSALKKSHSVHKLVALAFHGPQPTEKHCVNHKDGNKRNNQTSNLEWATPKQNQEHARDVLGHYSSETNANAKLTREIARAIYIALLNGQSPSKIRDHFGIGLTQIAYIKKRKVWKSATADLPTDFAPTQSVFVKGEDHYRSKLTVEDVKTIKHRFRIGNTGVDIANAFGVSQSTVYRIRDGISWKHVSED